MSWGATAFTPIVTYNTPPFGFEERSNPSDFGTCPDNPYSGSENLKDDIRHLFQVEEQISPYSNFTEHFVSNETESEKSTIFTFYNIVLFIMVMGLLYYITTKQLAFSK
jgi:hypothetical protein